MELIRNSKPLTFFGTLQIVMAILLSFTLSSCAPKEEDPDLPQKVMPQSLESTCNSLYSLNERGRRVSWKGAVPIHFMFDRDFPAEYAPAVEAAMNQWNQAAGIKLFKSNGYRKTASMPANDGVNTIYFADAKHPALAALTKASNEEGAIAATHGFYHGNKMIDTDIVFNGVDSNFSASRIHLNSYDVEATALHELGHVLGLAHNNTNPMSIMFFGELPFGFSLRQIDSTSQQILQCEYNVSQK